MSYIGVEGSSYVGKTTALNELKRRGYLVIPEYDHFGPFPASNGTMDGLKGVVDELLEREQLRSNMLKKDAMAFSDRTPISIVTFEDMKIFWTEDMEIKRVHEKIRSYALEQIHLLIESRAIKPPTAVAVLRLREEEEFLRRVRMRGVTAVGELALFSTQLYIADQALAHSHSLLNNARHMIMDVGTLRPSDVADRLVDFANITI